MLSIIVDVRSFLRCCRLQQELSDPAVKPYVQEDVYKLFRERLTGLLKVYVNHVSSFIEGLTNEGKQLRKNPGINHTQLQSSIATLENIYLPEDEGHTTIAEIIVFCQRWMAVPLPTELGQSKGTIQAAFGVTPKAPECSMDSVCIFLNATTLGGPVCANAVTELRSGIAMGPAT